MKVNKKITYSCSVVCRTFSLYMQYFFLQPCLALITLICILHPKIRINPILDCQAELFLDYILRSKSSEHLYSTYYLTGQYAPSDII